MAALKEQAKSSSVDNPTHVEMVSALIWKCAMAAFRANSSGIQKPCLLTHSVNLRRKAVPPLPENLFGNLFWFAAAQCTADTDTETVLPQLVRRVREAIANVNADSLKKLEGDQPFEALKEMSGALSNAGISSKEMDYVGISSWSTFGLYELDFGWGKPIRVSSAWPSGGAAYLNVVHLVETRWGDGIEAWVSLDHKDMAIFQSNNETSRICFPRSKSFTV